MTDATLVTVHMTDDAGLGSTVVIPVAAAATLAQVDAAVEAAVEALDAVTGAKIDGVTVTFTLDTSAWTLKGAPVADSLNYQGAILGFSVTGTTRRFSQRIPALNPSLISEGLIVAGTSVATYTAALLAMTNAVFSDLYNAVITAHIASDLSVHKRQRP